MSSSKPAKLHHDVNRLMQQLHVDAFEFRNFDRGPQDEASDVPDFEPQTAPPPAPAPKDQVHVQARVPVPPRTASQAAPPSARPIPPSPGARVVPPLQRHDARLADPGLPVVVVPDPGLQEIFGRLLRHRSGRAEHKAPLKLSLPIHPSAGGARRRPDTSTVQEVFQRLARSSATRVSLIRSRD